MICRIVWRIMLYFYVICFVETYVLLSSRSFSEITQPRLFTVFRSTLQYQPCRVCNHAGTDCHGE